VTARPGERLPQPGELPSIVFRAMNEQLWPEHIPGEVARQISAAPAPGPDCGPDGQPGCSQARSTS
jgi:hypothetical protein